ncbi:MAG: HAD-IIB family hydrolase [Desulfobacteraceae bacterium]|jgi:sucrose-phosphate synthase|nr:HAD-IIB family hydrolase [Desulfobacteraceae bacterium]
MTPQMYHIQMFSVHGLLRAENMQLGHDADTGGQIKYVVELCNALSQFENVKQVELFTRLIHDKAISEDYARPVERVNDKFSIVRIQCGGKKYIRKEMIWPHLDEYVDKTIKYIKRQNAISDIVHGHYPDGGYVAMQLAEIFGTPFVYTGHSLGRSKLAQLINEGMKEKDIRKKYKIDYRIQMEEEVLKKADLVITSTHQELTEQYGQYHNKDIPNYHVIPPGLDIEKFYPFYHDMLSETAKEEIELYAQASILEELNRFFMHPDRPVILSLCRPDKRKNIAGLIKAYGEDLELQSMANLAVFAGIRKDINHMEDNERDVLTEILLLMDKYDLYGKIAIPKKHDFEHEVPELYRIAAEKKGVFVNSALTEPFGLTLIEAASCGLPMVAPDDGGPRDIVKNCQCGILVNTTDTKAIAAAVKQIITDSEKWKRYSKNGIMNIRKHYTWDSHATSYMNQISRIFTDQSEEKMKVAVPSDAIGRRLAGLNYFIIANIDNTLVGDGNKHLPALLTLLQENREYIGFGLATGRTLESASTFLDKHHIPLPDVLITSVGAEIYYGKNLQDGRGWETHISAKWNREKIVGLLEGFRFLKYQKAEAQRQFKISYELEPGKDRLAMINERLLKNQCRYNLIYTQERYLDILPFRASKGRAIRYLSYKWEIPLGNFLVCGDSGNDEEMLRGEPRGVVVGNYSPELKKLKGIRGIYFAKQKYSGGILEGIKRYQFIEKATQR